MSHKEYRLFGTAGAGKTTELKRMVENAAKEFGSDKILLSSFSKTAARELVGRNLPVSDDRVATLHAHSYRLLGKPEIAETKDWLTEWNQYVKGKAEDFAMSGGTAPSLDEALVDIQYATEGDRLLSQYNLIRARQLDKNPETSEWMNLDLKYFVRLWEDFKEVNDILDFSDLIGTALTDCETAPFNPQVGFFDECQDFSAQELALVRKWAGKMEYVVMAGDDEQAIFEFKGASPEAFLKPEIDDRMKRILGRSWRVPRLIQDKSLKLIRRVKFRQEKNYEPRFEAYYEDGQRKYDLDRIAEGHIEYSRFGFQYGADPSYLVRDMADRYMEDGGTVMFLASCSYQLVSLLKALRENGIAFHNPYRKTNGAWNPLGQKKSAEKIKSYLAGSERIAEGLTWTIPEMESWTEMVKTSTILERGALKSIKTLDYDVLPLEVVKPFFKLEGALNAALKGDMEFLRDNAKGSYEKRLEFLTSVVSSYGLDSLFARPQVIVGTIHSVKGGEADTVVVCPDLSPQGYEALNNIDKRDSVFRQFYVAMTRSFQNLVIANPSGNAHIRL